jgi:nucleotide-binding universal stress UspA family protein
MFKHILIPSDGSQIAEIAAAAALELASEMHAKVTGFTAVEEFHLPTSADIKRGEIVSSEQYEKDAKQKADRIFTAVAARARAAGVEFDSDYAASARPYEAIIEAAKRHDCDLIVMGSHGRRGIDRWLHGSETQQVLTHSKIPTLVYR